MKKGNGTGKFILGAAVGATLGVLFAPKKGSETRKDLKKAIDNLIEKAKETSLEDVENYVKRKAKEIQAELADLDKEKVLKIAKEKAQQIHNKANDLVDMAIEKGTPVLEKAADSVRNQAIKVTQEILKKLEKEK